MTEFNGPMKIKASVLSVPSTEPFDKTYQAVCACGWRRDYGYMRVTCERETYLHNVQHGEPLVTVYEYDAPKLEAVNKRALNKSRSASNTTKGLR